MNTNAAITPIIFKNDLINDIPFSQVIAELEPVSHESFISEFLASVNCLVCKSAAAKVISTKGFIDQCTEIGIRICIASYDNNRIMSERFWVTVFNPNRESLGGFYLKTEMIDAKEVFSNVITGSLLFSIGSPSEAITIGLKKEETVDPIDIAIYDLAVMDAVNIVGYRATPHFMRRFWVCIHCVLSGSSAAIESSEKAILEKCTSVGIVLDINRYDVKNNTSDRYWVTVKNSVQEVLGEFQLETEIHRSGSKSDAKQEIFTDACKNRILYNFRTARADSLKPVVAKTPSEMIPVVGEDLVVLKKQLGDSEAIKTQSATPSVSEYPLTLETNSISLLNHFIGYVRDDIGICKEDIHSLSFFKLYANELHKRHGDLMYSATIYHNGDNAENVGLLPGNNVRIIVAKHLGRSVTHFTRFEGKTNY